MLTQRMQRFVWCAAAGVAAVMSGCQPVGPAPATPTAATPPAPTPTASTPPAAAPTAEPSPPVSAPADGATTPGTAGELGAATPATVPATATPEAESGGPSLGIGDPAPPIAISRWMTGEPVTGLESGQVHVVEFWATWCGPCLSSMPHLSQLQTQYGENVRFIGVTREGEEVVERFLAKEQSPGKTWKDVITYRLAIDQGSATNEAYMRAANQSGIPTAFIVGKDGVVEWIGHPMTMDEPLARVVTGEWDREEAVAEARKQERMQAIGMQLNSLVRSQQWDAALSLMQEVETEMGPSPRISQTRLAILQRAGRTEEAAALLPKIVEQMWDDAMALNEISWGIAIGSGERDLKLALKAAERASELRNHEDAAILDTLARVHYELGDLDKAIEWQTKAAERNSGEASITETLEKYRSEQAAGKTGDAPATENPEETETQP